MELEREEKEGNASFVSLCGGIFCFSVPYILNCLLSVQLFHPRAVHVHVSQPDWRRRRRRTRTA